MKTGKNGRQIKYATSKMHKKRETNRVLNKKFMERALTHIPNGKGAMQEAWITAPYQKWPTKMPSALLLPLGHDKCRDAAPHRWSVATCKHSCTHTCKGGLDLQ